MKKCFLSGFLCTVALFQSIIAFGELKPHSLFSDNAVLQRDIGLPVWGTATTGEKVSASFAGQTKEATASSEGKWSVKLDPIKASNESIATIISSASSEKK